MDTVLMDTEGTLDQQLAPSSITVGSAEELSGHDNAATFGEILDSSLDDDAKSSDATTDAALLAERFASIVYFSEMAVDGQGERSSTHHRTGRGLSGAESVRPTRGHRTPTRPWRLPADNENPKN